MIELTHYSAEMAARGIRRLAVISGHADWCLQQAAGWRAALQGDWVTVSDDEIAPQCFSPRNVKTLLGREFLHAIFDARSGFHAEALAALAGTLQAGSWLIVLTPDFAHWDSQPDGDSLRWSEQPAAIATPHFIHWLQHCLKTDPQVVIHCQGGEPHYPDNHSFPLWRSAVTAQQALCEQLLTAMPGVQALTAARGRGKSALAGMLVQRWPGECWVTAPAKAATDVLARFAGERFHFIAPDRLLADYAQGVPEQVQWLVVDEAAAIPAPVLKKLIALFPRVLLTTTIQGYEGTGRGFVLKFCAEVPGIRIHTLQQPLRWAENDPLEQWLERALVFSEPALGKHHGELHYRALRQDAWRPSGTLHALYQLLCSAHYRTSPLDLRRMMDAPGQHFSVVTQQDAVVGGLWLVEEGGLLPALAGQVWAGTRRPAGNLVAQSLAAHAGMIDAPQLLSRRISRIAVTPDLRRRGVGRQLVARAVSEASDGDYLSVSFGYTPALQAFWQSCGFELVRIGSQREASSGCYAAMAVRACSPRGEVLLTTLRQRFADELGWLLQHITLPELTAERVERPPDDQDWLELAGFAFASRPFESTLSALGRLLLCSSAELPLLTMALLERSSASQICQRFQLQGRRALLAAWREEAARGLYSLNAVQAAALQTWIRSLQ